MVYICSTNACSLALAGILRIPAIRTALKLPHIDKEKRKQLDAVYKKNSKPFLQGIKEHFNDQKLAREINQREQLHATKLEEAGLGTPIKTFKTNPKENQAKKK